MNKSFLLLILSIFSMNVSGAVWTTENQWNSHYEEVFGEWVKNSYNQNIFLTGPYKGYATDCADAAYAARLFFSYENKLPYAIKDPTGGNLLISNEMSRFDGIADLNKRFSRFVYYIFALTGTWTMPFDTYPMMINRDHVRPGAVNLHFVEPSPYGDNTSTSHTEIIKEILDTGVINFISSTVPPKARKLKLTSGFNFTPKNIKSGLRNWKWPEQLISADQQIEGYSLEQYKLSGSFAETVTNRLKNRVETLEEKKQRIARNFCEQILERIDVVKDSEAKRKYLDHKELRCFNAQEYEEYSTPSRDKKLKNTVESLVRIGRPEGNISKEDILKMTSYLDKCGKLEYAPGKKASTTELAIRAYMGKFSSDPNQFLPARWGDGPEQHIYCPENDDGF